MLKFNKNIPDIIDINSISDFISIINEIKLTISSGRLVQYNDGDEFSNYIDIFSINTEGPWPDFFILYFLDSSSKRRYRFSCEMYHGAGGKWERI